MKTFCHLTLFTSILLCGSDVFADQQPSRIYVWDFTTRDSLEKTDLPNKLTPEFEEALFGCKNFQVLERRRMDRLKDHAKNERNVSQVSSNDLATLRIRGAELVAFGDVFDDRDSGQVKITVTFENFEGEKKKIVSALIQRGLVNDASSRIKAMKSLVQELCGDTPPQGEVPQPEKTKPEAKPKTETQAPPNATSPQPGGDWPSLNHDWRIEMTESLPKAGVTHTYDFYQAVEQGDRLRIHVTPVNGANMKTRISVFPEGSNSHEVSKMITGQNTFISKGIPGRRVRVQIQSWSLGFLDVRVEKAN